MLEERAEWDEDNEFEEELIEDDEENENGK
jgi:hypothetical protein